MNKTALQKYNEFMRDGEEPDALERLRFFCSVAMSGEDWLDSEKFFDDVAKVGADVAADDLLNVIRIVREHPNFDDETSPMAQMMDEALAGKKPSLVDALASLAEGRKPTDLDIALTAYDRRIAAGISSVPSECAPAEKPKPVAFWDKSVGGFYIASENIPAHVLPRLTPLFAAKIGANVAADTRPVAAQAVPEPTKQMLSAGWERMPKEGESYSDMDYVYYIYKAMLAPAPIAGDVSLRSSSQCSDVEKDAALREALRDAVAEQLIGLYYCGQVWEAWSVGTMREDDFSPAEDEEEVVGNIVDAVIAAMLAL